MSYDRSTLRDYRHPDGARHPRLPRRPAQRGILIWVNGALKPRAEAVVSVFDQRLRARRRRLGGPARHRGRPRVPRRAPRPPVRGREGDRRWTSASTARELDRALDETLAANGMRDGVHVRLMVTRGVKRTPYQDPRVVVGPATVVIIAEYKQAEARDARAGHPPVHRARPPRLSRRAGPEAQQPQQAQLHHRVHPGDRGRRRRGADARPARLRRHLQLDPLLHRAQGRGVDVDRRLLPRRHHARQRAARLPRGRHPGVREELSA